MVKKTKKTEVATNPRFERRPDGWIKDTQTSIEWGPSSKKEINFKDAEAYCVKQGGRLPTRFELESILDLETYSPAIDKAVFPDMQSSYYWSSTPYAAYKGARWVVGFYNGYVNGYGESFGNFVRPCRSSQ